MRLFRFYTLSSLTLLSLLAAGCKSNDVDPRDSKLGTYQISYTVGLKNITTGATASNVSTGNIVVTKGASNNELIFSDGDVYPVTLKGNDFSIPKYTSRQTVSGNSYAFDVVGFGTLTDAGMTINYTTTGKVNNQDLLATYSGSGVRK